MFDVGFTEILFLGIIAVVVLGPEKLPKAIQYVAELRQKMNTFKANINQTLEKEFEIKQLKEELSQEILHVKNLEKKMNDYFSQLDIEHIQHSAKQYYPIEKFTLKAPYQQRFLIDALMQWPCFTAS